jgi:prepilin-type N-terminal cleavage/methylation domain-containing protein
MNSLLRKTKKNNLRISSGYTLIEILVSLTIVGLIFSFGFVNFREFSRRQGVISAARSLKGDLRLAQEQALAGKKPAGAECGGTNTLSGYRFNITSPTSYTVEAQCSGVPGITQTKEVVLSSDLSLSIPSPNPIIFKILGQGTNIPAGNEATITITQTGTNNTTTITVTSSGEIK